MYDGSLDIRISISFARLALNWVAAWGGDTERGRKRRKRRVRGRDRGEARR